MATDLSLIVLRSVDVDAARRFYEAIGLSWKEERHDGGPRHHSCHLGEIVFELYPTRDRSGGQLRLAFRVENANHAAEAAVAAGGRWGTSKHQTASVVVEDPDGNQVELIPSSTTATIARATRLAYGPVLEFVRNYTSGPNDPPPFDVGGVIHIMLAALDNLHEHWLEVDLDQIALSVTPEQRQHLIKFGEFLRSHDGTTNEDAG